MGDPFKKVQRGERLRISAETFNTFIDAAKDFRQRTQDRGRQQQSHSPQAGIILVQNGSGEDLNRFDVLGIERPIFTPSESLLSFQDQLAVVGVTPAEPRHLGGRRRGGSGCPRAQGSSVGPGGRGTDAEPGADGSTARRRSAVASVEGSPP
jgi:hypothetical protein